VAVGSTFTISLTVRCAEGCDLYGLPLRVTAPEGSAVTCVLATAEDGASAYGEVPLTAPKSVGEHVWTFALASAASPSVAATHTGALRVPICTRGQGSSLAVWSIPSPVTTGAPFEIAVGARSAGGCVLTGTQIEVRDQDDHVLGRGQLGATPWPGTSA